MRVAETRGSQRDEDFTGNAEFDGTWVKSNSVAARRVYGPPGRAVRSPFTATRYCRDPCLALASAGSGTTALGEFGAHSEDLKLTRMPAAEVTLT